MRVTVGGQSVALDVSGIGILLSGGVICVNDPPWSSMQASLFPDVGLEQRFRDDLVRVVGLHDVATLAVVGRSVPRDATGLERFARSLGLEVVWVGADEFLSPEGSKSVDALQIEAVTITSDPRAAPSIVGGFAPGDTGGACFLLDGDRLLLPSVGSVHPRLPDSWSPRSAAFWIGGSQIVEGVLEAPRASLR